MKTERCLNDIFQQILSTGETKMKRNFVVIGDIVVLEDDIRSVHKEHFMGRDISVIERFDGKFIQICACGEDYEKFLESFKEKNGEVQ